MTARRLRTALAVILTLLLIGMQQEVFTHALSHLGTAALADQPAWHAEPDSCAECALLAAGSAALTGTVSGHRPDAGAFLPPASPTESAARAPNPYYRSRAPPLSC